MQLPAWVTEFQAGRGRIYRTARERVRLVVEMSRLNVEHGTGGPFAAAIFDRRTNLLVAAGVNMVLSARCSIAHAEITAIMAAQQLLGCHSFDRAAGCDFELVSSTEPCAMCQGATIWAGVSSLVYAARGEDACAIGFDEGPKAPDWIQQFQSRGIAVTADICRKEAVAVLKDYRERGGIIYNGRGNAIPDRNLR